MAARMSTAEMEQRDYELEIIRMEFMDKISEIAREALESQKKLIVHTDTDFPLSNASDWVTNQSEFITKLINNWKGNELFRDLVGKKMNNLDTIDKNVNDLEFIDTIMPSIGNAGTRIGFAGSHNGRVSDPNASYFYNGVTQEEFDKIPGNKYFYINDSVEDGTMTAGTSVEIEELESKRISVSFGNTFG